MRLAQALGKLKMVSELSHEKNIISFHCMGVSKNSGTPKSSILIGFSIINHPFWGIPIFGNTHIDCLINGILIIVYYKFPV